MASSVFSYERASSHASVAGSGRDGAGGDGSGGDGAGGDGSAGSGRLLDAASPELPAGSGGGCSGGPAVAMPASAGTASSDAVPDEPASGAHEISGAGRPSTCRSYMLMSCLAKSGSKSCGSMSCHRATRPSESGGFSSRSPLLVGGGKTFGPRQKSYHIKMNKKEKQLAISTALMGAAPRMTLVSDFTSEFAAAKTQSMRTFLERLKVDTSGKQNCLMITKERHENT